ncbi:hypothetical protein [Acrocarpospora macrocephala]
MRIAITYDAARGVVQRHQTPVEQAYGCIRRRERATCLMGAKLFDVVLRGYSRHQVDALWARLEANEITSDELQEVALEVVMRGYDRHQVHAALLDEIKRLKERSEG